MKNEKKRDYLKFWLNCTPLIQNNMKEKKSGEGGAIKPEFFLAKKKFDPPKNKNPRFKKFRYIRFMEIFNI